MRTRNFSAKLPQISVCSGFALVLYHILAVKSTVFLSVRYFTFCCFLDFLFSPHILGIQRNVSDDESSAAGFLAPSATSEFRSAPNYGGLSLISLVEGAISNKRSLGLPLPHKLEVGAKKRRA